MDDFTKENIEAAKRYYFKEEPKDLRQPHERLEDEIIDEYSYVSKANNDSSSKVLYEERLRYKQLVNEKNYSRGLSNEDYDNQLDTWYKEDAFFSKTTKYGRYLLPIFSKVKNINDPSSGANIPNGLPAVWVLDFVADAFNNFRKDFFASARPSEGKILNAVAKNSKGRVVRNIGEYGKYLKAPHPSRGVSNKYQPFIDYFEYLEDLYGRFIEYFKIRRPVMSYNGLFKNFKDSEVSYEIFEESLLKFLNETASAITFDGFLKKEALSSFRSYLSFDVINPEDSSSDELKLDFLRDPKYPMYARFARKNGFKIDPNNPWRLYADLRTAPMQLLAFSNNQEFTKLSFSEVQKRYYQVKSNSNMILLPEEMRDLFSTFVNEVFFVGLGDVSTASGVYKRFYDIYLSSKPNPYSIILGLYSYYLKTELKIKTNRLELIKYNKDPASLYRDVKLSEAGLLSDHKMRERLSKFLKIESISSKNLIPLVQSEETANLKRHITDVLLLDSSGLTGGVDPVIVSSLRNGALNAPSESFNDLYETKQSIPIDRLL